MGTYSTIQARVLRRVIDAPPSVVAEVPTLVNEALLEIQRRHNFKVMEALSGPTLTVASTRVLVAQPANWKEARGLPWMTFFSGAKPRDLYWAPSREAILDSYADETDGSPRFLLLGEPSDEAGTVSIEVWPLTDTNSDYSDGEYRILIPYWRKMTALSAGADTNWFTVNAEEYIVNKATSLAFGLDWDEERMAVWNTLAESKLREAIKSDKMHRLAGHDTLLVHSDGANAPKLRS